MLLDSATVNVMTRVLFVMLFLVSFVMLLIIQHECGLICAKYPQAPTNGLQVIRPKMARLSATSCKLLTSALSLGWMCYSGVRDNEFM